MGRFNERFHPNDSIGYAYGIHHDTANLHVHVAICPRTENGSYVGCSTSRSSQSKHKKQMDCIKSWFEVENSRWEKILSSPQKLEETLSKRLDADKLAFFAEAESLAVERAAERPKFRLILAAAALPVNSQCGSIVGRETASTRSAAQLPVCFATPGTSPIEGDATCRQIWHGVERRSLRELQSLLFNLKRQYRTLHKRYSQIYGFSSYAHRSAQYPYISHSASLSF